MSFKGKVTERKKIMSPIGPIEVVTTEYGFPRRKKVIWWMGEMQAVEVGELITVYHAAPGRKSDFEPIKWEPLCYEVELNEEADADDATEMFFTPDEVSPGKPFEFDELEEAEEFIELLKCKSVTAGGIEIDSRAEFKRWKKVMEIMKEKS